MSNIIKEDHSVTAFHPSPKPDTYVQGNIFGTKVHFNKDIQEGENLTFIVKVETEQLIDNNTRSLCIFNTMSKYDVNISKNELTQYENWHPLVQKSIVECNRLYKDTVKGTYLEGTDIPPLTE